MKFLTMASLRASAKPFWGGQDGTSFHLEDCPRRSSDEDKGTRISNYYRSLLFARPFIFTGNKDSISPRIFSS